MRQYRFSDLLDVASLQRIAEANYRANGMPVGIIDARDGSIIVAIGGQEICTKFHRLHPAAEERCRESDTYIKANLRPDVPCKYKCKNGLWDIGIPIIAEGQHLATLFLGQFFYEDERPDRDFFRIQAASFGFDESEYLAALDKVPSFSREMVENIIEYDKGLAGFLASTAATVLRTYRTEVSLNASLKKYSALIQTTDTGYVILDKEGKVVDANEVYVGFTGHETLDEIIGRSVAEWTADYEKERNIEEVRKCFEKGFARNLEIDYSDSQGKITPVEINATVIDAGDGPQILTLCRGITERRKAEEALRLRESYLSAIIENQPGLFWLKDCDGRFLAVNTNFSNACGFTNPHAVVGKTDMDIWSRELAVKYIEDDARVIKSGTPCMIEEPISDKGEIKWFETFKAPIIDTQGTVIGTTGYSRDITERKKSEQKIREQIEFTKAMMNTLPVPIFYKDCDGRFLGCNQAFLLFHGKPMEDIVGVSVRDLVPAEYAAAAYESDRKLLAGGGNDQYETKSVNAEGHIRDVILYKTTFEGPDHRIEGTIGAMLDITEYRSIEEKLRQSQKMEAIGQLAGGIAHDFNNMLGVIISYAELLKMHASEGSAMAQYVEGIENAAMRSRDITRQLLAFSRKQIIAPKQFNINTAIVEIRNTLSRLIGENIDLQINMMPDLWDVRIDPSQLDQILINLAVNARDAMPAGGCLAFETANICADELFCQRHEGCFAGEYVRVVASDNGSGMDRETLAHIFEPFFTTKDIGKGTGLGLATVYGIVRQNEGFISVESEPGKGAIFTIYLPRAVGEQESTGHEDPGAQVSGFGTILLVEDDDMLRLATQELLEAKGYTILAAASAKEAIEICLKGNHIDLLITDIVMPATSGTELSRQLADLRPGMRVLFMSGYTSDTVVRQGVEEDAINFIQKPFSSNALLKKIEDIINK